MEIFKIKEILIFVFLINKIYCECFYKCQSCTEFLGDSTYHNCTACNSGLYFLTNSQNCYYDYELPKAYFNSIDEIFYLCSDNCYECINNANTCTNCNRGYQLNNELNICQKCIVEYPNTYIFVSDEIENCKGGVDSMFICELKKTKCTEININTDNFECPREYPLFFQGTETKECTLEIYDSSIHTISNQIIKTQWLNEKIQIGTDQCWYITKTFSSEGDLILETNIYEDPAINTARYFYGIKSNGRPFFYDDINDNYYEHKTMMATTDSNKFESQLIKINIVGDEKDYFLSCSFTQTSVEIIDFYNNKIIGISGYVFFGEFYWSTKTFNILELKNEMNSYLFCFIALNYPTHYVFLQKYKFYKTDLSEADSYERIRSTIISEEYAATQSKIISCFEISTYNKIQCFYININKKFVISLFEEDSLNIIKTVIIDDSPIVGHVDGDWDYYFQNILFKNERSILSYILDPDSHLVFIQIKNLVYKNSEYLFEDHYTNNRIININTDNRYSFTYQYSLIDLTKIDDKRFCLTLVHKNHYDLYIILFDFYGNNDSNLFIRYYHIPLKLYDFRIFYSSKISFTYNGFLGLVFTIQKFWWVPAQQYFSLFSYIKCIDSELIELGPTTTLRLSDYANEQYIDNNIFGVTFYGIKIVKLPNNIGVYYLSKIKKKLVFENDILDPSDIIIFVYDYTEIAIGNLYTIELAGVVQEPPYEEFNQYAEYTEYYRTTTQESFFTQKKFVGKSCFYKFSITDELTGVNDGSCLINCKVCYETFCVKCTENYIANENLDTCLVNAPIDGYYYDENSLSYKECHYLCRTCSKGPILNGLTIKNSNCDTCITKYYKEQNTNNCSKCYENCKTCNEYKKNSTYFSCTSCDDDKILYERSKNCLNCPNEGLYANYYQYKCIAKIPDGYYLSNPITKVIDKCYITCKHCNVVGNSNDHKCIECSDAYPYNYNNGQKCLDDCSKENLYLESENNICYNDCSNNNLNSKKYNYKHKCISLDYCPKNYILDDKNNFVSTCDPKNDYEFNNECYKSCPDGTILDESITDKNMCICKGLYYIVEEDYICINSKICPTDYPYLKIGTSECTNCPVKYKGICMLECPEGTCITQINENLATCVEKLDETKILAGLCFDDFLRILDGIGGDDSSNIVMNDNSGITLNIYTTKIDLEEAESKYQNLTFIDLGECENQLREYYKIDPEQKFCVISVDAKTKLSNKATNDFNYEIYLDNGTEIMDFSPCKDYPIDIRIPIINLDIVNYNEAMIFDAQGYNIYDIKSDFYTDKCTAAYINGNDIIIKDRIEDIYPHNVSFCSQNCQLTKADIDTKRFNCLCNISSPSDSIEDEEEEDQLNVQTNENFIAYLLDMINYKVFGCPKILVNSSFRDYISNVGLYLGLIVIIYNFISCCIFYCYVLFNIRVAIYKLIPTDLYLYKRVMELNKKEKKEANKSNSQDKSIKTSTDLIQLSLNKHKKMNKKNQRNIIEGVKNQKEKKVIQKIQKKIN